MRRRRTRRSGTRRKSEWHYARVSTNGTPYLFDTKSIIAHWAIWPVGTLDQSRESYDADVVSNPTDLTLIRSISACAHWCEAPNGGFVENDSMYSLAMGLIKFAHPDPALLDGQVFVSGDQVPGAVTNATMDWVWRKVYSNRSFGSVSQALGMGEQDFPGFQSRAMRKLSQNEGILQTLEFILWNDADLTNNARYVSFNMESRMLLKEA